MGTEHEDLERERSGRISFRRKSCSFRSANERALNFHRRAPILAAVSPIWCDDCLCVSVDTLIFRGAAGTGKRDNRRNNRYQRIIPKTRCRGSGGIPPAEIFTSILRSTHLENITIATEEQLVAVK